ncbi:MAG: SMI1/KNR4 family protein [Gemmataceae bacterium]|nr:SMI1/KNR4 family protein [Gemmataceae bacterium]
MKRCRVEYYRYLGADLADTLLLVIETEIGDSVWLDTANVKPDGECPVIFLSHETGQQKRAWSSVGDFLEELLTPEKD